MNDDLLASLKYAVRLYEGYGLLAQPSDAGDPGEWVNNARAAIAKAESTMIDAPNLDAMNESDLRDCAKWLIELAMYANKKARAIRLRLSGHIADAMTHEADCERIYRTLPKEWKW
jgi:hypothetical protein